MNKKLYTLIILIIPIVGYSQSIGIKVGIIKSNTNYSKYFKESPLTSQTYGFIYQQSFKRWLLSVEPGYTTKGFTLRDRVDINGDAISDMGIFRFNYLEMPVLMGYNIIDKKFYVGLNVGLNPNILMNFKFKSTETDPHVYNPPDVFHISASNKFVLDVLGGVYLGYKFSDHFFISVNARYGNGITKISKGSYGQYHYVTGLFNVGYKF